MGTERSTEYAPGKVSSQDPIEGAPIPLNRVVQYRLAATPLPPPSVTAPTIGAAPNVPSTAEPRISVPSVVGWELKRGSAKISKARLVPQVADKKRSGKIVRQEPQAGSLVDPGTNVLLSVSVGSTPPPPPSPWLWVTIILGALIATGIIYIRMRRKRITPHTPKVELVSFKDYGVQQIASPSPIAFGLELCPVVDSGDQKLEKVGPLVAAGGG